MDYLGELLPIQPEHHELGTDHRLKRLLLAANSEAGSAYRQGSLPRCTKRKSEWDSYNAATGHKLRLYQMLPIRTGGQREVLLER